MILCTKWRQTHCVAHKKKKIISSLGPVSGPESVTEAQETKRALAARQLKRGGKNKVLFLMEGKLIVLNKPKVLIGGEMERPSLSPNVGGNEDKREEKDV